MSYEVLTYAVLAILGLISTVATLLAILEKDLVKAVIFSAIQSTVYAFIYYILMAPDIDLVYIPVAVGLYPGVVLFLIKKTERFEGNEG
ncbi:MAG: sodium:proton antiporter [Desulfurococcales archaeon ex4484_42]|nr:MAG: sodium:proton antiporter [Desulfurococcales archaeon ex4484_42]